MAKSNSNVLAGIPLRTYENFGARIFAAIVGPLPPPSLWPNCSRAFRAAQIARFLEQQYAEALAAFADDEIVTPGTPGALAEFE